LISRISPSTQFKAAKLLAALAVAGLAQQAVAAAPAPNTLPTGGQVVAGTATIATAGNTMNVNQTSQRAVVNWSSFDVGSKATVNFNQPNAQAATLNYVNSASKSMINGAVNANGQVIFVNNNGIVFGKSAQVNVGGMVATTMNTSAKEFMEGRDIQTYEGGTSGKVINKGNITGNNINSYIALMAPQVINTGVITATMGGNNAIALVAGQKVTLQFSGSQFVSVSVDASVVNALISNKLLINAGNGQVIIGANAAQNLMGSLIKNTGTISASDINTSGGKITLTADTIEQSGAIEASSSQAAGGNISLKGNHITLASGSKTIATGATSGGNINVGVNNASTQSLQNAIENNNLANTVSVQTNATVDASATQSGNGGAINIWSKLSTMVAGTLSAKGGAQGGNGGFIETSSKGTVSIASATKLDTSAPKGRAGQWVIDPTTLIIDSAAAAAISNALNTTSVTLDATGSSCSAFGGCTQSQSALIRIMAGADIYSSNTASSLSLVATGGQIDIDSNITAGAVYAVAQTINVNGSINTNGGPNSNIYLAGAIINILGNINSNGNSQNSNTNTTSSSLNTINTSTANNRRNGSTANNQNTLTADGNNYISNGGLINILTTGDINIGSTNISNATNLNTNPNSYISANGVHGGTITILSTAGKVNVNAVIDTLGKSGNAGKIDIAGKDQTNLTNALISTEGISQGGLLNLGQINNLGNGTILAPPATAPPALSTYVQNTVAAAALNSNNGITSSSIIIDGQTGINAPNGNIVVFGDQIEVNHSSIIADHGVIIIGREGYSSGGLSKLTAVSNSTLIAHKVETSAELLGTDAVTVLASEWLLDPTNVTIAAGAAGGSTGGSLASALVNAGVITITAGDIQAAINAGTSVNVVATGEITQSGALNFVNNSGTAATLTLDNTSGSKKAMTLSGGITATGSSLTNIVAKTAGGQIVISGAVNVTGAVTLDNTYAVGGSTSGFINETNGITYIGAVAGSIWGVKNTGTITAKTISVTAANSGYTNMGFWAAANLTASGDINVYATNQFAQTSAGAGSVAFYTNSALNITSTGGTVNIIGKVQGTSANYSSGGIHFANATAAATVNVTANKISLEGYSTNSAVDTSTTGIGINSNFTKFTINAGADYSAGGPAISFYGSSIVGAGRGLRITNGTITNNASGGDVLLVANNNIFNSNNIVVATNNTANASKVLFDTTSGNSTGTIENSGAITSTGGTTATGSNLTNILVKSSGGKIFSSGTINISGDITVSNRYNVGGTNSTFINQYNASANTATYLQTTAGVTITAGISAKNINIYGAYNGYLSSAVWLQANLTATGNINLAGYHSIAAAAGNNNGSAGIYTNGALNFNAGGTFFVDGNTNSTVAGLSGIGVYLWAGTGTAKLNVIANKIQILGSSTNTSAGGDTTATSLNLANGVNFTIRNSNDYVNGGEAFSFRSTVVTNFGRGIRVSNGSITNNSNGGDIVFVSNGSIGTFVPISLAKNTSTVATKVLYDTTTATSTGFIDNTGAITVAADSTSAVNLIQKSNGGTISNGAGAINVSGYIDINNNAVSGPSATATTLNSLGASITGPMTSGTLAGNIGVRINAIATGTGLGINGTSTITSLVGPVTLTGQSATANAIKLTGAVSSAAGFTAVGTSTTAPTVVAVAAITNTTGNISITGNAAAAGANTGISATGAITQNQVGGNISFISNNKISQTGTVALVANTGGTAANVLYDTRTGNSGSTIQNGALSIGAGTSTSAINFSVLTNGALITNGGVIVPGYILIDNTNGSSSTATLANVNGTTIIGALSAGTLAGSTGVRINTVSSGTGVGIQDVAAITALAGPVTLTSISETANSINLTAASSITSAGGISIIGTSSQAFVLSLCLARLLILVRVG
jgi:filamentous hemagglutinin family protein